MRLPALLLRSNKNTHKNDFGHVLVVAGSPSMLGAAALVGFSAMRSGAGLTTIGVAKSLNLTLQKKISNVIMTLPLLETTEGTIAVKAFDVLARNWKKYSAVAIGPGMTMCASTVTFIQKMYANCPLPMIVDADALNALALTGKLVRKSSAPRILTPHPGEMARLTGLSKKTIEADRKEIALKYSKEWRCVVVLKGHRTAVASPDGEFYVNTTGNAGMATAGSGDVLTGMMGAFLAQKIEPFEAAKSAVFFHGKAGDLAAQGRSKASLIASDIIIHIPLVLK
ncbi:MAG: NAD(P)H-hydrate dehydratase [Candidatus Omnitrophica bacterium]|nr:NAD(P)H-hydrate dehydratase [Candidatus Omnitrophota bacterium]